jgi:methyltransferase (TIGR00027 family)
MPRTDNDTWDLASSVGATATMVAAARAAATRAVDPVIDDRFAEPLVRAVGVDFFTRLATGELAPTDLDPDGTGGVGNMNRFADAMAARTRYFDEFFAQAVSADGGGIRQAVILASGLDARAYRLDWPEDMVVFEIDQPQVLEFKAETLADMGAAPTTDRRAVPIDLRNDWPRALADAGFDASRPTAWIAEGLLGYLPPEAQDQLLDTITALSPWGSRIAAESVIPAEDIDDEAVRERMQAVTDQWRRHGFDLDFSELVYTGDRADVAAYLQTRGWTSTELNSTALLLRYGLITPEDTEENFANVMYVSAQKD